MQQKKTKKIHWAWSMYDWANSAYNLVITSTIFPIYYLSITRHQIKDKQDYVSFFGWELINSALLNYAIAFAYLIIAFLSPFLASLADHHGNKKKYMKFFTYLGSLSCVLLYFFTPERVELGIILAILAAIGYCGSLVFYNSYLPDIANDKEQDKLSARGFALGYIGSVLLQVICLLFIFYPFTDETFAPRLSFLLVGIWWISFAQISFYYLPDSQIREESTKTLGGFSEIKKVYKAIQRKAFMHRFLLAFFIYSMGVQTVMLAAAEFGAKEIRKFDGNDWVYLDPQDLIITILLIQLVAIAGAYLIAKASSIWGNIKVLKTVVAVWFIVCILAWFTYTNIHFYLLASLVGLIMGGIQSLSRSTYSKMVDNSTLSSSYFSFYDLTEKVAIVIGMFSFALIEHISGKMRLSIIALAGFFLIGFILLQWAGKAKKPSINLH